ncbi:hypothetical protein AB4090_05455 [Acidithiobacillus sp. IBUN Pt1247-S3]|uniref:hypothetical protein n=1 Tax=Acidithiobacillus sp. IBUN Pt1247-S3 TaxID=3166642 RepID=UPI0034E4687F
MFSIERIPETQWPIFHTAALVDGQSWLQSLQRVEGVDVVQEDGRGHWRLSPRIGSRYFGVMESTEGETLWAAQHPEWIPEDAESEETRLEPWAASLPLSWFALIPWKAQWLEARRPLSFLRLALEAVPLSDHRSPRFSLEIPVARSVFEHLRNTPLQEIRSAVGNPLQVPLLGFHFL